MGGSLVCMVGGFNDSFLCLGCRGKKEIVCKSREIKVDSSSTVGRRNSLLQQAFISRSDSEVVEEHLEQIVFIYPVDTASQVSVKIMKNSLDRRTGSCSRWLPVVCQRKKILCLWSPG